MVTLVACCALLCASCATPSVVREAHGMSLIAQKAYQADANSVIDGLYEEIKAQSRARYVSDFAAVERALLEEQGNTGLVDLGRYKNYADKYAAEMGKEDAFWDALHERTRLQLDLKASSAARLGEAVQTYENAESVPPSLWNDVFGNVAQGAGHIIAYRREQDALTQEDARVPNLDHTFEILSGKVESFFEGKAEETNLEDAFAQLQAIMRGDAPPERAQALIDRIRELLGASGANN